jgi:type IV secretory pathway protease TraF
MVLVLLLALTIALADKGGTPHKKPSPQVTLAWNASDSTAIGYYFKLGFSSGAETQSTDVGNVLTHTVALTSRTTYYFVVTAYNSNRVQSLPSNEVSYTTP